VDLYLLTHSAKGNEFHADIFTFGDILQGQRIGYFRVSSLVQKVKLFFSELCVYRRRQYRIRLHAQCIATGDNSAVLIEQNKTGIVD
jgi:hypothetical protein